MKLLTIPIKIYGDEGNFRNPEMWEREQIYGIGKLYLERNVWIHEERVHGVVDQLVDERFSP